ncbi:uncharacterized protein TrAFT101_010236 [Trichoderma asperellum]|uniref:uncharacterized protein n=1 Tax=Trichoderma asperellum TaxID=101201 RepID=UPI00331EA370|nr:hypothetical protein TrAFT101_010236 [Trichoderma asperellum]
MMHIKQTKLPGAIAHSTAHQLVESALLPYKSKHQLPARRTTVTPYGSMSTSMLDKYRQCSHMHPGQHHASRCQSLTDCWTGLLFSLTLPCPGAKGGPGPSSDTTPDQHPSSTRFLDLFRAGAANGNV